MACFKQKACTRMKKKKENTNLGGDVYVFWLSLVSFNVKCSFSLLLIAVVKAPLFFGILGNSEQGF